MTYNKNKNKMRCMPESAQNGQQSSNSKADI